MAGPVIPTNEKIEKEKGLEREREKKKQAWYLTLFLQINQVSSYFRLY